MTTVNQPLPGDHQAHWVKALNTGDLEPGHCKKVRLEGKQIAVFNTRSGLKACDNRCPHEGYPLVEGEVSDRCILTCNWHNWKFDLESGENLYGGDQLRVYPVVETEDGVWIDIADAPYEYRYKRIVHNLKQAFDDHSYDRLAREIARLKRIGADPLDVLRLSIEWSYERLEFGWTHAYAAIADWLVLYHESTDDEFRLVCLLESVAHVAFDVLREPPYGFADGQQPFNHDAFVAAIENEDEAAALAMVRGGIRSGLSVAQFEPALTEAALAHYHDFGHSLIYVSKIANMVDQLGEQVALPLLLSLVRHIIFATREDKIPEFRGYDDALRQWTQSPALTAANGIETTPSITGLMWHKQSIKSSLNLVVEHQSQGTDRLYRALLEANTRNLLLFDVSQQQKIHVTVSGNINWLDFTHGLTFATAVYQLCQKYPQHWAKGLLQMACFLGRNSGFVLDESDQPKWLSCESADLIEFNELIERASDHGQDEYIVSIHWIKTVLAGREMSAVFRDLAPLIFSAVDRYISSPLKLKQTRRTAYQSMQFVAKE